MTTLVTGAPGWLGNALVRRLCSEGREVRCLIYDQLKADDDAVLRSLGVECVRGNILNTEDLKKAMRNVTHVFHAAAEMHPPKMKRMFLVNEQGTRNVAQAASRANVTRFVHVSTIAVHGYNPSNDTPFREDDLPISQSSYGQSKWRGELAVRELAANGELSAVILRPGPYYGPGASQGMKLLIKMASRVPIGQFGKGQYLRSLIHIENAVDALLLAESSAFTNAEPFLVADARPYSVAELLNAIGAATGKGIRTFALPQVLASMCFGVADGVERLTKTHLAIPTMVGEFARHCFCSIDKIQQELEYKPERSLAQGIREAWLELNP
ncbi:MAG TPA: NAD-dependent epimerase/dehydratase family protein [Myxococcales bacterium]|nr:NAD-dependent epimerase/dehydratase family protein [Myxococcales bacterium]